MSVSPVKSLPPVSLQNLKELRELNKKLGGLEVIPVSSSGDLSAVTVEGTTYQEWIDSAEKVLQFFKKHQVVSAEEKKELAHLEKALAREEKTKKISLKSDLAQLEELLVSLKIRSRLGCSVEANFEELTKVLLPYRQNREIFKDKGSSFGKPQLEQIRETCERFPLFAKLLIERNQDGKALDDLTTRFVKWALRSGTGWHQKGNNLEVFIKMPIHARDLMKINIDRRIGSISEGRGLEIRKDDGLEKLCLKIDGTFRNIMKGHEQDRVALVNQVDPKARPVEVTIQEIFDGFKEKTKGYGEFDWFDEKGVTLWNAIKLGSWNPDLEDGAGGYSMINPNDPTCLESMPVTQIITREELELLHKGQEASLPKDGQWGFALRATRNKGLHVANTHGFCTLYQPMADGRYRVYSISLQAIDFPITLKEQLEYLAKTCDAGIHYPDESAVLSQREHKMKIYPVSEEKIREAFIPRFQQLVRKAQADTLYFQPQGKNCAYVAHSFFDSVVGSTLSGKIKELSKANLSRTPTELKTIFAKAFKYFDEGALEKLVDDLLATLIQKGDMEGLDSLFDASLELLSTTLFKDHPEAIASFKKIGASHFRASGPITNQEELTFAMKHLLLDAIHSIQHYRIYVFDADFDGGLEGVIGFINLMPWQWLRDLVGTIVIFLLFLSWRTKTIIKKRMIDGIEVTFEKKISLWNTTELERKHEFYLPSSIWKWEEKQEGFRKLMPLRIEEAKKQLETIA